MTGTVQRARGRWREILPQLGIDTSYLRNKHGPCPLCGGTDRFRWDDKDGSGGYYCNQCGPGSGMTLVMKKKGLDFAPACCEVDAIIGTAPPEPSRQRCQANGKSPADRLADCNKVLRESTFPDVVTKYLRGRRLSVVPPVLRGHRALPYFEDRKFIDKFPAVVAPIVGPDDQLQSVHRLYLGDVRSSKKTMPPVDTINGAAVRLFDPADTLGVAEGIETAIAAFEIFDVPTWACLTAAGLEAFQPPAGIKRLVIFSDNDRNYVGQKAAITLANRLSRTDGLVIEVQTPLSPGTDWLDFLNERDGHGAYSAPAEVGGVL